ncbi:MAG: hypothetical protein IJI04_08070 [Lachnospiraceae bacterium]|jgi:hypothetical protein|nr:hypothetical protein [Lachnospiraceae bacterium]
MKYIFLIGITAAVIGMTAGMLLLTYALLVPKPKVTIRACASILLGSLFLAIASVTALLAIYGSPGGA